MLFAGELVELPEKPCERDQSMLKFYFVKVKNTGLGGIGLKQRLEVTRRLIAQGQLLVKPGQKVAHDTIVGRLDYIPGQMVRCNVADQLGIAPKYIQSKMMKELNDWVDEGEILAKNDEFYTETTVDSPTSGYVALVSRFLGNVFIRVPLPAGPKEPIWYRAEDLGMSKLAFTAAITVKQGSVVDKGRVLITSKPPILSPAVGRIREISVTGGYMILAPLYQATELPAHLDGTVVDMPDSSTLVIRGYGYQYQGVLGYGGEQVGYLKPILNENRDLTADDLPENATGSVLLARGGVTLEALKKAEKLGVKGFILGTLHPAVLREYSHEDPLTIMGQRMDIPFTLILMQGFGSPMPENLYQSIAVHNGMRVSIDGSTQLRAGVQRPQIMIALPESEPEETFTPVVHQSLLPGDQVILIREPHFGETATILAVSSKLEKTEAETMAAVVNLRLENGHELQVPVQNCQKSGGW